MRTDDITAIAPGRVNLIGDHTDYTGGLCLPMAIHLATTIVARRIGDRIDLVSESEPIPAIVPIDIDETATQSVEPFWARYVAGVAHVVRPPLGLQGKVSTTIPVGAGLSSSAAFEVALALALGFDGSPIAIAEACQRAENIATGVPTGILDQLASASGRAGQAMLLDCHDRSISYVPIPDDVDIVVIHSGQGRQLAASGYGERVLQCMAAEGVIGPLRSASLTDLDRIADPIVRSRARHVISENQRVRDFAAAMAKGDFSGAGRVMVDSHVSLRNDYESSHPTVDALVSHLIATPGVHGARITGGGFGGCVVAMTEPGCLGDDGWRVRPASGAALR